MGRGPLAPHGRASGAGRFEARGHGRGLDGTGLARLRCVRSVRFPRCECGVLAGTWPCPAGRTQRERLVGYVAHAPPECKPDEQEDDIAAPPLGCNGLRVHSPVSGYSHRRAGRHRAVSLTSRGASASPLLFLTLQQAIGVTAPGVRLVLRLLRAQAHSVPARASGPCSALHVRPPRACVHRSRSCTTSRSVDSEFVLLGLRGM